MPRTSTEVLSGHNLTGLQSLVRTSVPATASHLYAIELAAGNVLAAAPRLTGTVQVAFAPQQGTSAEHLEVSTNLIWAYALKATYPVFVTSDGVVTVHEHMRLDFYLDKSMDGPAARVVPARNQQLQVNGDCAFFDSGFIGLPRVDDPNRTGGAQGAGNDQYDVNASVTDGAFGCR